MNEIEKIKAFEKAHPDFFTKVNKTFSDYVKSSAERTDRIGGVISFDRNPIYASNIDADFLKELKLFVEKELGV